MSLKWEGDRLIRKVRSASLKAVNEVMSKAVIQAKRNHPGWRNRTGKAEGSIRIVSFAQPSRGGVAGLWGSVDTNYMIWLEIKHGSALRNAADRTYPMLAETVRKYL